jgi:hypothetical protein
MLFRAAPVKGWSIKTLVRISDSTDEEAALSISIVVETGDVSPAARSGEVVVTSRKSDGSP